MRKHEHIIQHRDFGEYVLEFCVGKCSYKKKLLGKNKDRWQEILAKGSE